MLFQFPPAIQAGLAAGKYLQVFSSTGVPLSIVRDAATGQFVAHAVGVVGQPFLAVPKLVLGLAQMVQTDRGFQKTYKMLDTGFQENYKRLDLVQAGLQGLQASVGVLQATTAVIGVGVVAGVALSAVNLHQTLKLRQDVKQLRLEVKNGFIDLKQALKDQRAEIMQRIEQVAEDVEFKHHRTILVRAYGLFAKAIARLQSALMLQDMNLRNSEISGARDMLFNALADYDNGHLLEGTCSAGQLRRQECVWAIEQAITTSYQLQGAYELVSDRLAQLQHKIRQDALTVIDRCESEDELDFLFPEITRIHNHDLAVLKSWQNHVDWIQTLSPDDRQLLASSDIPTAETSDSNENLAIVAEPEEQLLYENLKQKSHYLSLRDQLQFMLKPDLRQNHESYISQQATASGYKALAPSNWQEIPDLTVANLYWYFKVPDDTVPYSRLEPT